MLTKQVKKIKVIQTDDPAEFEALFNAAAEELSETEFETEIQQFAGHIARIFSTRK